MSAKTSLPCCSIKTQGVSRTQRPAPRWRRGGELAAWFFPSAVLVLLPKCPACVAAYVALFSGVGISMAAATNLRTSVLILCIAALAGLMLKSLCRMGHGTDLANPADKQSPVTTEPRGSENRE